MIDECPCVALHCVMSLAFRRSTLMAGRFGHNNSISASCCDQVGLPYTLNCAAIAFAVYDLLHRNIQAYCMPIYIILRALFFFKVLH